MQLEIPEIEGVQDLSRATVALLEAVATGELTPIEAAEVAKLVEAHHRTIDMAELEKRLQRIRGRAKAVARLTARLGRTERLLRPQERVHVVEVPAD